MESNAPLVRLLRSARVHHRVPLQHQLLKLAPPLRFPVLPLLSDRRGERIEVAEVTEVVVGERDVLNVREGGGEEEGGKGEEGGEIVVGERDGDDLVWGGGRG